MKYVYCIGWPVGWGFHGAVWLQLVNADVAAPWRAAMLGSQWVGIVKMAAA